MWNCEVRPTLRSALFSAVGISHCCAYSRFLVSGYRPLSFPLLHFWITCYLGRIWSSFSLSLIHLSENNLPQKVSLIGQAHLYLSPSYLLSNLVPCLHLYIPLRILISHILLLLHTAQLSRVRSMLASFISVRESMSLWVLPWAMPWERVIMTNSNQSHLCHCPVS